jgi:hypothetical protein
MGARTDLLWVVLPVVTGYLCLYAKAGLAVPSLLIFWFWSVALNGPHFYATISRTYLDRRERAERPALLIGSFAWLLLGPLCLVGSIVTGNRGVFLAFWVFQILWAYFHVVRQHYGFMVLYQRRNGERAGSDNPRDYWFFHVAMFGLAGATLLAYPDLRRALGLPAQYAPFEAAIVRWSLPVIVAATALYAAAEILAYVRTRRVNVPKMVLLGTYLPFHVAVLLYPMMSGDWDLLLVQAAFTMPHNLQYMAIVWFYNRNRFGADADGREYGMAGVANKTVWRFAAAALASSIVFFYARWFFEGVRVPLLPAHFPLAQAALGQGFRVSDLVGALWIGFVFHHQYLDQKIWKVSRDATLRHDLRLGA